MGYEVAATLGVKLADHEADMQAFIGDASFKMLHSEIMTAMQEGVKINILVMPGNERPDGGKAGRDRLNAGAKPANGVPSLHRLIIAELSGERFKRKGCGRILELASADSLKCATVLFGYN
jgi:hypothetical protein